MKLDADGAARGIAEKIAKPLKIDTVAAAQAIVEIAISKMSLAVREVSVQKGYDPRDFALVASGGAGPLHVIAIARELHIPTVIVPLFPSHFSALGMLAADERHDFIRTYYSDLAEPRFRRRCVKVYEEMRDGARGSLRNTENAEERIQLDIRYVGQDFTLSVPVTVKQSAQGRPQGDPHRVRQALRAPLRPFLAGRPGRDGQHAALGHRQAADAEIPAPRQGPRQRDLAPPRRLFHRCAEAGALPGLSARDSSPPARASPARRWCRSTAPRRCCSRRTCARSRRPAN